jgi:hypothetical protein
VLFVCIGLIIGSVSVVALFDPKFTEFTELVCEGEIPALTWLIWTPKIEQSPPSSLTQAGSLVQHGMGLTIKDIIIVSFLVRIRRSAGCNSIVSGMGGAFYARGLRLG